jgi:glyoxylase-like metal-dependent hydrolase (beta-lactamase superfamily II)
LEIPEVQGKSVLEFLAAAQEATDLQVNLNRVRDVFWRQILDRRLHQLTLHWLCAPVAVWLVRDEEGWSLVDTGPPRYGPRIAERVENLIGEAPVRIIVTHGHVDHIGGLGYLRERWKVPVFAHAEEIPFMRGEKRYRELRPAPMVHRVMARFAPEVAYPGLEVQSLAGGDVLAGMEVVHVPGHSPGMIALWHRKERFCLAADAFRFKLWDAMPLMTYDRELARASMRKIAALEFDHLYISHGRPILQRGREVARRFAGKGASPTG